MLLTAENAFFNSYRYQKHAIMNNSENEKIYILAFHASFFLKNKSFKSSPSIHIYLQLYST
jgi:hypothetical protein